MIPIPNLPTDSLYKFLFVGGIIIMLSSVYLFNENSKLLSEKLEKQYSLSEKKEIQFNLDNDQINELIKKYNPIKLKIPYKREEIKAVEKSNILIDSINLKLNKLLIVIKKDSIQSEYKNKIDEIFFSKVESNQVDAYCLTVCGIIFFLYGAINWQNNIQKPQDRMTIIQLELMEMELKKAKEHSQVTIKYSKSNPPFYKRN